MDDIADWEIAHPQRTFWFLNIPSSSDNGDTWKTFVINTLGMAAKEASTVSLANQAVKNWCLM